MANNLVRVELVGLLPEFYRVCTKCQPVDYLLLGGTDYIAKQMAEYPPEVLEEQRKLFYLYERLTHDFAGAVVPVPVNLLSLRGLWLSLWYRVGRKGAVVISGKRVLDADLPY